MAQSMPPYMLVLHMIGWLDDQHVCVRMRVHVCECIGALCRAEKGELEAEELDGTVEGSDTQDRISLTERSSPLMLLLPSVVALLPKLL